MELEMKLQEICVLLENLPKNEKTQELINTLEEKRNQEIEKQQKIEKSRIKLFEKLMESYTIDELESFSAESSLLLLPNKMKGRKGKNMPIVQMDMDGKVITEYNSIAEASNTTGFTTTGIRCACIGMREVSGITYPVTSYKGFKWSYKNE